MSIIARSISSIGLTQDVGAISSTGYMVRNQSARSGVNRLMLAQLQEESLRQDELRKKQQEEAANPKKAEVVEPKKVQKKAKKKPVKLVEREDGTVEEPEVLPLYLRPVPSYAPIVEKPNYTSAILSITSQLEFYVFAHGTLSVTRLKTELHEEELELLLLAA